MTVSAQVKQHWPASKALRPTWETYAPPLKTSSQKAFHQCSPAAQMIIDTLEQG